MWYSVGLKAETVHKENVGHNCEKLLAHTWATQNDLASESEQDEATVP